MAGRLGRVTWWCRAVALGAALGGGQALAADVTMEQAGAEHTVMAPPVDVAVSDGVLRLEVSGAPLADVLWAIGEAGGFRVTLRGELSQPVDVVLEGVPVEEAIRQLVWGHTLILVRDEAATGRGRDLVAIKVRASAAPNPRSSDVPAATAEPDQGEALAREESTDQLAPLDRATLRAMAGPPPTKEAILADLKGPDPESRIEMLPRVSSFGADEAVTVLRELYVAESDPLVRSRAIAALSRVDGPEATALLAGWARGDGDPAIRRQALNALAATAGPQVTTTMGHALRTDSDPDVRTTALKALQRVGGAWARGYVARLARDRSDPLQPAAAQALASWDAD